MPERVQFIPVSSPLWSEYLDCVNHDLYFTGAYHAAMQDQGQGEAWLAVVGGHDRFLAWPFLLRNIQLPGTSRSAGLRDVTSVYGYPGPLIARCHPGDPFLSAAWQTLADAWRACGVVSVFSRFHPLLENHRWVNDVPAIGERMELACGGRTVSIDLARSDREAWADYRDDHRRSIHRARRAGLVWEVDDQFTHLSDFVRLYHDTMRRNGAAAEYFFGLDYFNGLRCRMNPAISLHLARAGSRIAGAALVSEYQGMVQYLFGAADDAFVKVSPLKLLIETVRQWAVSRGNTVFHLGGGRGGHEDSLFYFKGGFSMCRHPFYTGRCILAPEVYRDLTEEHFREAGRLGFNVNPHYFPAYRAAFVEVSRHEEVLLPA